MTTLFQAIAFFFFTLANPGSGLPSIRCSAIKKSLTNTGSQKKQKKRAQGTHFLFAHIVSCRFSRLAKSAVTISVDSLLAIAQNTGAAAAMPQ